MKFLLIATLSVLCSKWTWALPVMRVAFSLDKPPYVDRVHSTGLEVEILRMVFQDMGYQMTPVFQPPARSVRSLELGRVDAMATITNMDKFHLSDFYITFQNYAWTLKNKSIQLRTLSDLQKKSVIAFQNARYFLGPEFNQVKVRARDYQEYADQLRQLKMLLVDRVDVIICEERILHFNQLKLSIDATKPLPEIEKHALFPSSKYSVAFRTPEMRDRFNQSLRKVRLTSSYQNIFKQYTSELPP